MWAAIIYIVLLCVVISLSRLEKKLYNTYITPFTLMAVPYCVIIFYQFIVINIYDMIPISNLYLLYILVFLLNFWICGVFLRAIQRTCSQKFVLKSNEETNIYNLSDESKVSDYRQVKFLKYISIIAATYLIVFFLLHCRGLSNIGQIVQQEFQNLYVAGVNFYIRLICMIGSVYFLGMFDRCNKHHGLLGLYCCVPIFLTFVKGVIIIVLLGGVIANILLHKRILRLKTIIYIIVIGISVFLLVYIIEIGIWDTNKLLQKETYEYIFAKLNIYLISGVQSFNVNVQWQADIFKNLPNPVYAPVTNLVAKTGMVERIDTINNVWVQIGYIKNYGEASVNTNTYIGTLVLYCGFIKGILINSFIAVVAYEFFFKAIYSRKTICIIRYSLFITGLLLAWFEYYYMHTFWVYLIIIFMFIDIINKVKIKIN